MEFVKFDFVKCSGKKAGLLLGWGGAGCLGLAVAGVRTSARRAFAGRGRATVTTGSGINTAIRSLSYGFGQRQTLYVFLEKTLYLLEIAGVLGAY